MFRRLISLLGIGVFVLLWWTGVHFSRTHILPTPLASLNALKELSRKGLLFRYSIASLYRVTWGYLSAVVLGVPLGLLLGSSRRLRIAFNPYLQILRPISPLAWIPISILWFGVGDVSAIFIIFVASFLPITVSAMNAVANVSQVHIDVARNMGLSTRAMLLRVLLPSALPQLIVGLRIALGIAWLVVVAAEMIAVNSGLGFLIIDARNAGNRYDVVVAGMMTIGALGLLLDQGMRRIDRIPWLKAREMGLS